MKVTIRQETEGDYKVVYQLIEEAFKSMPYSDHDEHNLVNRLRMSPSFIPELSLVAELEGEMVGHILFTKVQIKGSAGSFPGLSLAPVSVLPKYQGQGIGGQLILKGHQIAQSLGYHCVALIGHDGYYPRFGYQQSHLYGITFPFEISPEYAMVVELKEGALNGVMGQVEYDPAFFERG